MTDDVRIAEIVTENHEHRRHPLLDAHIMDAGMHVHGMSEEERAILTELRDLVAVHLAEHEREREKPATEESTEELPKEVEEELKEIEEKAEEPEARVIPKSAHWLSRRFGEHD